MFVWSSIFVLNVYLLNIRNQERQIWSCSEIADYDVKTVMNEVRSLLKNKVEHDLFVSFLMYQLLSISYFKNFCL